MTDTRTPRSEHASAQAVAWIARQLRWEDTLAALRRGREAEGTAIDRKAA
jgi:hypothetical protein